MGARVTLFALVLTVVTAVPAAASSSTVACKHLHGLEKDTFVSQAPVPADFAAQLGVLRRPPTDADRGAVNDFTRGPTLRILYGNAVRLVRTDPDGRKWYLFLGKSRVFRYPKRCLARLPIHQQHVLVRLQQREVEQAKVVRMGLFEFDADGGGGGSFGIDLRTLLTKLTAGSFGSSKTGSTAYAIVPDGVASVDLTFRDGSTESAPVENNLWVVKHDESAPSALPRITVWRAADGSVIRTLRAR